MVSPGQVALKIVKQDWNITFRLPSQVEKEHTAGQGLTTFLVLEFSFLDLPASRPLAGFFLG